MTLLYITVPFVALALAFLAIGKLSSGGWDALDYLVYAMATGVLWAVVVVCYLVWVVLRDGWQPSSFPAIAVLVLLAAVAAGWGYREFARDAGCRAAQAFFVGLPAMPAAERAAAIRQGGAHVRSGSDCAIDGLRLALGRHVLDPEPSTPAQDAKRRAILEELLEAGLPPTHRVLYEFAASDADPVATRMLLRRRKLLAAGTGESWDLFPDDIVRTLITYSRTAPGDTPDPNAERYRATLAVFVDEGLADPGALPPWLRETLIALGLLAKGD
ncbi:MAG: hypothetical protein RLO51_23615 [Thalassobaculum sp.]|uniref:hypothetical protein n=1 Tax=Thalassobaculum sp. TaxID=2022740 RepID=UPI0032EB08A1